MSTKLKEVLEQIIITSHDVRCDYAKLHEGERLKPLIPKELHNLSNFLFKTGFGDCTSVTQALLFQSYLGNDVEAMKSYLESSISETMPDPLFWMQFPTLERSQASDNDEGMLIYLEHDLLKKLNRKDDGTPSTHGISTNAMGWWCIGLGVDTYKDKYPDLWVGDHDPSQESYLAFWGKREGSESTMAICHYSTLKNKLVETAIADYNRARSDMSMGMGMDMDIHFDPLGGMISCLTKLHNIDWNTVSKKRWANIYHSYESPKLLVANVMHNMGMSYMAQHNIVGTDLYREKKMSYGSLSDYPIIPKRMKEGEEKEETSFAMTKSDLPVFKDDIIFAEKEQKVLLQILKGYPATISNITTPPPKLKVSVDLSMALREKLIKDSANPMMPDGFKPSRRKIKYDFVQGDSKIEKVD
jgi:hypothetical protein